MKKYEVYCPKERAFYDKNKSEKILLKLKIADFFDIAFGNKEHFVTYEQINDLCEKHDIKPEKTTASLLLIKDVKRFLKDKNIKVEMYVYHKKGYQIGFFEIWEKH